MGEIENEYVAHLCFSNGGIHICDSDTDKAFKVWRRSALEAPSLRHKEEVEKLREELGSCVHCKGTGDGYCDADGWHDCEKCNGTGMKNGVREIQRLITLVNEKSTTLNNLLAVIHRDGGHYEQEHGSFKAGQDAEKLILGMRTAAEDNAVLAAEREAEIARKDAVIEGARNAFTAIKDIRATESTPHGCLNHARALAKDAITQLAQKEEKA